MGPRQLRTAPAFLVTFLHDSKKKKDRETKIEKILSPCSVSISSWENNFQLSSIQTDKIEGEFPRRQSRLGRWEMVKT
ncbi:Hypothetical protein NTJ_08540 [Nesidiocoris tenuis]|uniref:Uncharacterized protein n=1 Tax=Nesidiocoris tenuis TaxID=355587 RepID=A0ABN7AU42_9HEMI|nr:Hypothetical protein NTJ_08540 [Nesidiocoris tenuis]